MAVARDALEVARFTAAVLRNLTTGYSPARGARGGRRLDRLRLQMVR